MLGESNQYVFFIHKQYLTYAKSLNYPSSNFEGRLLKHLY